MFKVIATVLGLLVLTTSPAQARETIRVVADPWAPFGGEDLPGGGISLDVISTVLSRAGYTVDTHIVPWERALDGVRTGDYDVIGSLFYLPELEDDLTYSEPFYESEVRFLQRRGAGLSFSDLDSLRPYSIAVGAGYLYEEAFDRADYLRKTEVTTVVQGVQMVASGRVDLTLDSVDVLRYVIAQEAPELADLVEVLPNPLSVQPIHMAVRRDLESSDQLIADFNRVLARMRADGTLEELLARHRYQPTATGLQ